ncbi:MAG: glutamate-1-semialdehyde 2,1-aminomutase [Gemmatimonadaceae bacterium]
MSALRSMTTRSEKLFAAAQLVIPGGVNSPVRAFASVGGTPRFIAEGKGAWLTDEDGQRYIDYVLSWGPLILGHAHPAVVEAVCRQATRGTSFGAPTELETEMAERVCRAVPSMEMVRFVSSGTEAMMSAVRLARAATGRRKVIKFSGNYHGHSDALLAQAGSGVATLGLPDGPGVTPGATADTLTARYNDLGSVELLCDSHRDDVAAIAVEPVAGNMGLVLPEPGFLPGLRAIATRYAAALIFDEVMTGFRVAFGGAQVHYGVSPDLTCLGKVIGGGLPVAAFGGRRDLMMHVAPAGPMYQAGTLSGNPLAMAAGIATLEVLGQTGIYAHLTRMAADLAAAARATAAAAGVALQSSSVGGMWGFFFSNAPIRNYDDAKRADTRRYARLFHALLERGVYLAPSQFEAAFVCLAHDLATLDATRSAFREAMTAV